MKKQILIAALAVIGLVGCERSDRAGSKMNEPAGAQSTNDNRSYRSQQQDQSGGPAATNNSQQAPGSQTTNSTP